MSQTPYLDLVPKNARDNLRWRIKWREAALADRWLQEVMRQAAFEDVLFWFNAFCWCFEPRAIIKIKPFVTWPHQDPAILTMDQAIDDAADAEQPIDVTVDKSRGQGATWMYLMILLRRWLRDEMFSAGLVTRTEDLVDSARDPDTLLWKVVWMLHRLPFWMLPHGFEFDRHRSLTDHSLFNPEMESTIVGYSATGDVARGGRKTVFGMDELAAFDKGTDYAALNSTQHVTRCRFLVSTFKGDTGAYYEAVKKDTNARKIVLDWKDNPTQNRGLYRVTKGKIVPEGREFTDAELETIRRQHDQLRRRGYVLEGKVRNIWYNAECLRPGVTPRGIAQELDRDPHGSVSKVFSVEVLKAAKASYCRPPLVKGRFVYDSETAEPLEPFVVESEFGEFSVWCKLDIAGRPPLGRYVIGCDIGGGTGGSYTANSVAHVLNKNTGEQVAEWVSNTKEPRDFAYVCVALCHWFYEATLIPEANFGGAYLNTVIETLSYPNLYYRESDIEGLHRKTEKPGFWMKDDDTKLKLFELLQAGMATGSYIPRSEAMLIECGEYEWAKGKIIHIGSTKTDDEGAKGKAHADRVIAAALAVFEAHDVGMVEGDADDAVPESQIPVGSMAARLKEFDRSRVGSGDPWEESGLDVFRKGCATETVDSWS